MEKGNSVGSSIDDAMPPCTGELASETPATHQHAWMTARQGATVVLYLFDSPKMRLEFQGGHEAVPERLIDVAPDTLCRVTDLGTLKSRPGRWHPFWRVVARLIPLEPELDFAGAPPGERNIVEADFHRAMWRSLLGSDSVADLLCFVTRNEVWPEQAIRSVLQQADAWGALWHDLASKKRTAFLVLLRPDEPPPCPEGLPAQLTRRYGDEIMRLGGFPLDVVKDVRDASLAIADERSFFEGFFRQLIPFRKRLMRCGDERAKTIIRRHAEVTARRMLLRSLNSQPYISIQEAISYGLTERPCMSIMPLATESTVLVARLLAILESFSVVNLACVADGVSDKRINDLPNELEDVLLLACMMGPRPLSTREARYTFSEWSDSAVAMFDWMMRKSPRLEWPDFLSPEALSLGHAQGVVIQGVASTYDLFKTGFLFKNCLGNTSGSPPYYTVQIALGVLRILSIRSLDGEPHAVISIRYSPSRQAWRVEECFGVRKELIDPALQGLIDRIVTTISDDHPNSFPAIETGYTFPN